MVNLLRGNRNAHGVSSTDRILGACFRQSKPMRHRSLCGATIEGSSRHPDPTSDRLDALGRNGLIHGVAGREGIFIYQGGCVIHEDYSIQGLSNH